MNKEDPSNYGFLKKIQMVGNYLDSMTFSLIKTLRQYEDRTWMLDRYHKPHDGCKAIEPSYTGYNSTIPKIGLLKQFLIIIPVLIRTSDQDIMLCQFIYSTMDVRPLTFYSGYGIIIEIFRTKKHFSSGIKNQYKIMEFCLRFIICFILLFKFWKIFVKN